MRGDAHLGADGYPVGVEAVAGGVGLGGDGLVEEGETNAGLAGLAGGGGGQAGDGGGAGVQVDEDVLAAGLEQGMDVGGAAWGGRGEGVGQVGAAAGG